MKNPNEKKSGKTRKLPAILLVTIMVLTVLSSLSFISQDASASPLLTGDIAHSNATVSYASVKQNLVQTATNITFRPSSTNSTATPWLESSVAWTTSTESRAWYNGSAIPVYVASGENVTFSNGTIGFKAGTTSIFTPYYATGTVTVNITVNGTIYSWSDALDYYSTSTAYEYIYVKPYWNVVAAGQISNLKIVVTDDNHAWAGYTPGAWSTTTSETITTRESTAPTAATIGFGYGYAYAYASKSSTFSVPTGTTSFTLNYSISSSTVNATYNSITQNGKTSDYFSGSLSVLSVSFQLDFTFIPSSAIIVSYYLYTVGEVWQTQPTHAVTLYPSNNSTATSFLESSVAWTGETELGDWYNGSSLPVYVQPGENVTLTNGTIAMTSPETYNGYGFGFITVNITVSGSTYSWIYYENVVASSYVGHIYLKPYWNVIEGGQITALTMHIVPCYSPATDGYDFSTATGAWSTTTSETSSTGYATASYTAATIGFGYGYTYAYPSKSCAFSIPSGVTFYYLNYSVVSTLGHTNATYNGLTQSARTSGSFTGSLSVLSVSFQADFANVGIDPFVLQYTALCKYGGTVSYAYVESVSSYNISQSGNYFNSSYIYFNYTAPANASTSFSANYTVKVSNLTLVNPSAPIDSFSCGSQNFTYYSISKYGTTYNLTAYKNYSAAQSAAIKFSTSEVENYHPTINYSNVKWTGTGTKAQVTVNASEIGGGYSFTTETQEITNLNWGDGSNLVTSSQGSGAYTNWTLYHYYTAPGSYTVTFQIINWVNNPDSLSTSRSFTYTVSTTISTSPNNNAILKANQSIWFNYSGTGAGLDSLSLSINGINQFTHNYSSVLTASVNDTSNYKGALTIEWSYAIGNISGQETLYYSTQTYVQSNALYILVNFTISSTQYSEYYFYSSTTPYYNGTSMISTYSYYTWNIFLPSGAAAVMAKGNGAWNFTSAFPGGYTYYPGNATVQFHLTSSYYQVVFLAKDPKEFATFGIDYIPLSAVSLAVGQVDLTNWVTTYVNDRAYLGDTVNTIPSYIGQTVSIRAYDVFGDLLVNTTYTVPYPDSVLNVTLPIYPVTVSNYNSSYDIGLLVSERGVTKILPDLGYYGAGVSGYIIWIPAGTYYFNYSYLNSQNAVVKSASLLTTISNVTSVNIYGITIAQVQALQVRDAQNITNEVESVNLTFVNGDSNIKNQTLNIEVSVKDLNSTLGTQLTDVNVSLQDIMSMVDHSNVSLSQKVQYIDSLINASEYHLVPGSASVKGDTYSYPMRVIDSKTDMPANLSLTQQAVQNMQVELVQSLGVLSIPYYITNVTGGSFILNLNLTNAEANTIRSGGYVALLSGALAGVNVPVTGKISSTNLPPDFSSVQGIFEFLAYEYTTAIGRAVYLIASLVVSLVYVVVLTKRNERKGKVRR